MGTASSLPCSTNKQEEGANATVAVLDGASSNSSCAASPSSCCNHQAHSFDVSPSKRRYLGEIPVMTGQIVRLSEVHWIWSEEHEQAIRHSQLTASVPIKLLQIIKEFAYHPLEHHCVLEAVSREEMVCSAFRSIERELLQKPLCPAWHAHHFASAAAATALRVNLHCSNEQTARRVLWQFRQESLPALTMVRPHQHPRRRAHHGMTSALGSGLGPNPPHRDNPQTIRRTYEVEDCQLVLEVSRHSTTSSPSPLPLPPLPPSACSFGGSSRGAAHVVLVAPEDAANHANCCCQRLWAAQQAMTNVLMFYISGSAEAKVIREVARRWNVPAIALAGAIDATESIHTIFHYAVKLISFSEMLLQN